MDNKKTPQLYGMNIELTTACPLHCPQCYCSLEGGKHIALETATKYLRQAKELGLKHVELSGGETLCYPHLYELIQEATVLGIQSNIAISGWHFDAEVLEKLQQVGLTHLFVSLNAPTEEMNARSRDGYHYAIAALELLKDSDFSEVYINWVMHRDTADTLPEMIRLAEEYGVKGIMIMTPKPTSKYELNTLPTREQMERTVQLIHSSKPGFLMVESCFSPLLAMASETKLLGNVNVGIFKGCGAGRTQLSVSVDGWFSPCRHLEMFEQWDTLGEYWCESPTLGKIRRLEEQKQEPCKSCRYSEYCRPCLAVNSKLKGELVIGHDLCSISE